MNVTCSAPSCDKPTRRLDLCGMHYARLSRIGQLEYESSDDGLEWRPVPEFPGHYEASNTGLVRRSTHGQRTRPGRVLKARINRHGYPQVTLTVNNQHYTRSVHALVCGAFHGPRPDGAFTLHLNDVKTDNRPENLRWGSNSENQRMSVALGGHPMASKTHCVRGHEFTPENTYSKVRPDGRAHRRCRECTRITQRARRASYAAPEADR